MLEFVQGNLLNSQADALVNTVNTVGVMGKGIALMFKEAFPENFRVYARACKRGEVSVGKMFVTERQDWVGGPRWIVNFPTKKHWRQPSRMEWVVEGLRDLRNFIIEKNVQSIALPPLGSGNGGLDWEDVRAKIVDELGCLESVRVIIYEPTATYQNVAKTQGVESLTPARGLIAEIVRRYSVLGFECTMLEIQKLSYLIEQKIIALNLRNPLRLDFQADIYGPFSSKLNHLLNGLDGSYLHCVKRVADAGPLDFIWFEDSKRERVAIYLNTKAKVFVRALEAVSEEINGFESPVGMELLATDHWLREHGVATSVDSMQQGLKEWVGGGPAADRKLRLFDSALIELALQRFEATSTKTRTETEGHQRRSI